MKDQIIIHIRYKKILSIICAILAGLSLLSFIYLYNLKMTVANPEFYKTTLEKANTYNRLINEGIPAMITETKISDNLLANYLLKDTIIFIIKKTIQPEWVETQTNNLIDQIAKIFSKPLNQTKITLKLDKLDLYLAQASDGINILSQIIPSCAESEKTNEVAQKLLNISIDCKSMNINLDQFKSDLTKAREAINKIHLTQVDINSQIKQGIEKINRFQMLIKDLRIYTWVALFMFLFFMVLVGLFQWKNLYTLIKYISITVFSASAVALIIAFIIQSSITGNITNALNFNLAQEMQAIIYDFAKVNVAEFFYRIKLITGVLIGLSAASYFITYILDYQSKKHK